MSTPRKKQRNLYWHKCHECNGWIPFGAGKFIRTHRGRIAVHTSCPKPPAETECKVVLSKGYFALVDEADYHDVMRYRWHVNFDGHKHQKTRRPNARNTIVGLMHRYIMRAQPGQIVDHINGDPLDNRKSNLRFATKRDNSRYRISNAAWKGKRTKGTTFRPQNSKRPWSAQINNLGKKLYLGSFATEEEAARAYDLAALKHFGEFALLNFPAALAMLEPSREGAK